MQSTLAPRASSHWHGGIPASPSDKCWVSYPTGRLSSAEMREQNFSLPLCPTPLWLLASSHCLLLITPLSFLLHARFHSCSFAFPLAQTSSCSNNCFHFTLPLPFRTAATSSPLFLPPCILAFTLPMAPSAPLVLSPQAPCGSLPCLSSRFCPSPRPPAPLPPALAYLQGVPTCGTGDMAWGHGEKLPTEMHGDGCPGQECGSP